MALWMIDDEHVCPLASEEHYASPECVRYARKHGDHDFIDHCGGPVYSRGGGAPEQCALDALHAGECKP